VGYLESLGAQAPSAAPQVPRKRRLPNCRCRASAVRRTAGADKTRRKPKNVENYPFHVEK
jgi:hypothetical protein